MASDAAARDLLEREARALLARLLGVRPFALEIPMVAAAAPHGAARQRIEMHLAVGRGVLRARVEAFLRWLTGPAGAATPPSEAQRRFALLRLAFNAVLSDLDVFADALSQRAEHGTGVWLAGLDALARDGLALPAPHATPPVICYLDRGIGAAIRRARTRLPGGGRNPVAVIRVPRERMVGAGIASSLLHEVGHQAGALLDLVESVRPTLRAVGAGAGEARVLWELWERWSSEILADLWAVAKLGIAAPLGLLAVVSLPRPFVFQIRVDDPHPPPWIRVKVACAIGDALYPHPQWKFLARVWESLYPPADLPAATAALLRGLAATTDALAALLADHRPRRLRGLSLRELLVDEAKLPVRLLSLFELWRRRPALARSAPPTLAFAVVGQARAAGVLSPHDEGPLLSDLLSHWALREALGHRQGTRLLPAGPRRARAEVAAGSFVH